MSDVTRTTTVVTTYKDCPTCKGTGQRGHTWYFYANMTACSTCGAALGSGSSCTNTQPCGGCGGSGLAQVSRTSEVTIA